MAAALDAADLVAIAGLLVCIGLLIAAKHILQPIAGALEGWTLDVIVWSGKPLAWLGRDIDKWVIGGIDSAISALGGVVAELWHGLVWSFTELLDIFTDLANLAKGAIVHLWTGLVKPWAEALVNPIRALAVKAEAQVVALETTVARNLATAERYAEGRATAALDTSEAFTRTEIKAARADAAAASAFITARLDGIGTQAEAIAGDIAATPGLVWDDLKKYLDVRNLADATLLGTLGGLAIHELTQATGINSNDCQGNQKALCGTNPGQWLKLLEGLALLGFAFDFKELVAFAEKLAVEAEDLILKAA